ncbi:MAG: hypothetical protein WC262_09915, partial [Bacteroidales bacterium]
CVGCGLNPPYTGVFALSILFAILFETKNKYGRSHRKAGFLGVKKSKSGRFIFFWFFGFQQRQASAQFFPCN